MKTKYIIKQHGATLVSLIVAMALSTFLIAGMLQVFVATKNNYKLSQNIAELNDAMRFAVSRMSSIISYAGYRVVPVGDILPTFAATFTWTSYVGQYMLPMFSGGSSQIDISFQSDGASVFTDCSGTGISPSAAGSSMMLNLSVNSNNLVCTSNTVSGIPTLTNTATLVSDLVVNMWVAYGYDANNNGNISYYYYPTSTYVTNITTTPIRAVRVALLLRSRDAVLPISTTKTFSVFGGVNPVPYTVNDQYIYRFNVFTVPLGQLPVPMTS